jgi:hydrogenase maturation protease
MTAAARRPVIVAGIGSEYRQDDGAGVAVARSVAIAAPGVVDVGPIGEPLDLLGRWDGAELAVIVDATRSGTAPGTIQLLELDEADGADGAERGAGPSSTHGIGIAGVLRLARAVGQAPQHVVVVGIEGERFGPGIGLCPQVERSVPEAAAVVLELVKGVR